MAHHQETLFPFHSHHAMGQMLTMELEEIMRIALPCLPAPLYPAAGASRRPTPSARGGEDRISRLPGAVLSEIVSRLPAKDAARTAVLSRRWRRVWASTPLVLDDSDLLVLPRRGRGDPTAPVDWCAVTDAVSRAIGSHPGPIRSLRLTCCFMALAARFGMLDYWLQRLADGGAEDLVLFNRPQPKGLHLPADVLRIASLRTLYLAFWRFPDTAGLPRDPAVFPHLREIGLFCVSISTRDLDHLLACSPVLEKLAIVAGFYFSNYVRIRSRSLQSLVFWKSLTYELAVVVAPRLQRLILLQDYPPLSDPSLRTRVKIGYTPELRVLGYLEPAIHQLEIGGALIESGTKMIPSSMVPSVKILALKVQFGIRKEAKMLPAFLRCFPNVETLHVLSHEADEPTGKLNLKFWQEVGPINSLEAHITKVVFDKFRGERCELAFLKFILERAQSLLKLVIVLANGDQASVDEMLSKLKSLTTAKRASECPTLLAVARDGDSPWCFERASDLSVSDPFDW